MTLAVQNRKVTHKAIQLHVADGETATRVGRKNLTINTQDKNDENFKDTIDTFRCDLVM